ncbi:hypothetical protein EV182_005837, partial [Spiromyces aspiralis]
ENASEASKDDIDEQRKELESVIKPIIEKMYESAGGAANEDEEDEDDDFDHDEL